jgi:1-acyl-sn-glycerol-3-phosphate acyltransferase
MNPYKLNTEPWRVTWSRRGLTLTGLFLLAALVAAAFPILLPAAFFIDLFRRRSWLTVRCLVLFGGYLFYYATGALGCLGAWLLSGGGASPKRLARLTHAIAIWWAHGLWRVGETVFGVHTEVQGDDVLDGGPYIVFIRHVSLADTLLPLNTIGLSHGIRLRYVLKSELLWDPCVDIAGHRWQNVFVRRGSGEKEIGLVRRMMEGLGDTDGILMYPEGTRFTPEKRERILASMERKSSHFYALASSLKNVLPPRLGGALALLDENRCADAIFCAHTGLDRTCDLRDFWNGSMLGARIRVRFWRVPFADIPTAREARIHWLYEWWQRVDKWVGESSTWEDEPLR